MSYVSGNCQPWGINDGLEPKSSGEQPAALCHWWPHRGAASGSSTPGRSRDPEGLEGLLV